MADSFENLIAGLFYAIVRAFHYFTPKELYPGESFYWKYTGIILLSIVIGFGLWAYFGHNDYACFSAGNALGSPAPHSALG